jgi:hypothetical protein
MRIYNREYTKLNPDYALKRWMWLEKNEDWNNIYETDKKNLRDNNFIIKCPECNEHITTTKTSLKAQAIRCNNCYTTPLKVDLCTTNIYIENKIMELKDQFKDFISYSAFNDKALKNMSREILEKKYRIISLSSIDANTYGFHVACRKCIKNRFIKIENNNVNVKKCDHMLKGYIYLLKINGKVKIGATANIEKELFNNEEDEQQGLLFNLKSGINLNNCFYIQITQEYVRGLEKKWETDKNDIHEELKYYREDILRDKESEWFLMNDYEYSNLIDKLKERYDNDYQDNVKNLINYIADKMTTYRM